MWLHTVSVRFQKLSHSSDSNNMPESPSPIVFTSRFHNVLPQVTHMVLLLCLHPSLPFQLFLSVVYETSVP